MTWTDAIALTSPVVAVIIALLGFRRSSRADRLAAFFQIQERYLSPEVRNGRRLIYERIAGRSPAEMTNLPDDVRTAVGYTLAVMNSVAIACEARYVDRDFVERNMGRSYSGAVTAAKPFIDGVEQGRGFRPYVFAERMAAGFRAYSAVPLAGESDHAIRG
jgi:hypothetical protein